MSQAPCNRSCRLASMFPAAWKLLPAKKITKKFATSSPPFAKHEPHPLHLAHRRPLHSLSRYGMGRAIARRPKAFRIFGAGRNAGRPELVLCFEETRKFP